MILPVEGSAGYGVRASERRRGPILLRMSRSAPVLSTVLAIGLLAGACGIAPSPTPTPSVGPSVPPFVGLSFPADAPADCAYGGELAQVRAVDRLTVEFSLCHPDATFLAKLAMANNGIQDADWLAENGSNLGLRTRANGTGPYLVSEGEPMSGDQITLSRFDGYWGTKAIAATLAIQWSSDPGARLLALQQGRVDGIDDPAPDAFATIQGTSALQLRPRGELSTMYVAMSNTYEPFDSLGIRRALALGVDRQRIVDAAFPPGASLADSFTPCEVEFGCAGDRWYDRDPAAARSLLADPGFPGPLTTHIYYGTEAACGLPDPSLVASELRTQLRDDLGISADLQPMAPADLDRSLSAGLLDGLVLLEACSDLPDAAAFLDAEFNGPAGVQFGTVDREIVGALQAAERAGDPEARRAAYEAANNAIRDLVPMIPLAHGGSATAWKADLTGAASSPVHGEAFAAIDPGGRPRLDWMQGGSPSSFYCADATDRDAWRVCQNVFEGLYGFKPGTATVTPLLAESCTPDQALAVWTCHLRSGVAFHDGAGLDANDVLATFAAQWDYRQPMHAGRVSAFASWRTEFGPFLHAPATP